MGHATEWEKGYDGRILECVEASLKTSTLPRSRLWPISGPDARTVNPDGFEPLWPKEVKDPLGHKQL